MRPQSLLVAAGLSLALVMGSAPAGAAVEDPRVLEGELANGTPYRMVVPADWDGTLVLNADLMAADDPVGVWLNDQGYAVASRSRDVTDWAVRAGADDMVELKGLLAEEFGEPDTTVAYGRSLGGLVTRTLVEAHPDEVDAVVPMCGGGAGLVGMWNHRLDALFALQVLLAPDDDRLELVHVTDQAQTDAALREIVTAAMATEEGRARVALAGALGHFSGWAPRTPAPPTEPDAQLEAMASALSLLQLRRSVLEATAGGNISWNVGVDYDRQLAESDGRDLAAHFYAEAGLDLQADLDRLAEAERITPDADAVDWARSNGTYTGEIGAPVLSVFTRVDERGALSEIHPYAEVVEQAGNADLLRQVVVEVSGHCAFTPIEQIALLDAAVERTGTGEWGDLADPDELNARAARLAAEAGADLGQARFTETGDVPPFPRPFFAYSELPGAEPPAVEEIRGTLADGTPYLFVVPDNWNGTVLVDLDLAAGQPTETSLWADHLLPLGYAGAGTTREFVTAGWDVAAAVRNQVEALQLFREEVGEPDRSIAFGRSGGGNTAAAFAQEHPELLDGAVAMCGNLAGSVGVWNGKLDTTFALKTLLAPGSDLPVVDIPADPMPSVEAWRELVEEAQQTPEGRARIALAAALGQLPVWGVGSLDEPDPDSLDDLQYSVYRGLVDEFFLPAMFSGRRQELLGGGVPRWNNGIDYRDVLGVVNAPQRQLVADLYRAAGLDLDADLATLNAAERIVADPAAVASRQRNNSFSGDLRVPVVTLDNTGDVVSPLATSRAYADIVRAAGNGDLLRQAVVHSAGHCAFSAGEQAAVVEALVDRLDTGDWGPVDAGTLNERASALVPGSAARFVDLEPDRFARPFYAADVYDPTATCDTCAADPDDPGPPATADPTPAPTAPPPAPGGALPATGASAATGVLAALGLVLAGAGLALRSRPRRSGR